MKNRFTKALFSCLTILTMGICFFTGSSEKTAKASSVYNQWHLATECHVYSGTATYDNMGQVANASTTQTLVLQCPVPYDSSLLYSSQPVNVYGYGNGSASPPSICAGLCYVYTNGSSGSYACNGNYNAGLTYACYDGVANNTNLGLNTSITGGNPLQLNITVFPNNGAWSVVYGYSVNHL